MRPVTRGSVAGGPGVAGMFTHALMGGVVLHDLRATPFTVVFVPLGRRGRC
jgi:hypothetical protein